MPEPRPANHAQLTARHLVPERPETDHDPHVAQQRQFALEVGTARVALLRRGLVARWSTPHRGGHPGIAEREAVVDRHRCRLVRQPRPVHRPEEPVARTVPREHPAGAVRPVRGRRQPEHKDPRRRIPEPGDAAPPVLTAAVGRSLVPGDRLAPLDEPRARPASCNLLSEVSEGCEGIHAVTVGWQVAMTAKPPHSPSTLVLLVRHGLTPTTGKILPGRANGLHLSDKGLDQAYAAAVRISELKKVDAVYTSPLERARETAAPIGKAVSQHVHVERGLYEADFGEWTGQELKVLMKKPEWAYVQRSPSTFRFPGGESFTEMQTRMVGAIEKLRGKFPGGVIVAVSHADTIKAAVAHAMGTPLDLFQRIVISPCSISAIAYTAGGPIVLTVNSTGGSLADLRPS